jgi:hypothetical protein
MIEKNVCFVSIWFGVRDYSHPSRWSDLMPGLAFFTILTITRRLPVSFRPVSAFSLDFSLDLCAVIFPLNTGFIFIPSFPAFKRRME